MELPADWWSIGLRVSSAIGCGAASEGERQHEKEWQTLHARWTEIQEGELLELDHCNAWRGYEHVGRSATEPMV